MSESGTFKAGMASRQVPWLQPDLLWLSAMPRKVAIRPGPQVARVEALAFSCQGEVALIVGGDVVGFDGLPVRIAEQVREKVAARLGCAPMRIMFSAAHGHSCMPDARASATEEEKKVAGEYWAALEATFIEVCLEAIQGLRPAEIGYGQAELNGQLSTCRRMLYANGTVQTSWGMGPTALPGIKFVGKAAETVDDAVDILAIRTPGATRPFACLVTYGSHIHLLPVPHVTGELSGWVKEEFESRVDGLKVFYTNHMGGDMALINAPSVPISGAEDEELAWHLQEGRAYAKIFVDAVMGRLAGLQYERPGFLVHASEYSGFWDREPLLLGVHVLVLGEVALVNLRPELFNTYAIELRKKSPYAKLVMLGYNESDGNYVGRPLDYEQGSYEMAGILPRSDEEAQEFKKLGWRISPGRPEAGEQTVERIVRLLTEIRSRQTTG